MTSSWAEELIKRYPGLFVRTFRDVPYSPAYPVCPEGWKDIVIRLAERVSEAGRHRNVRFTQILEQRAMLHIHWSSQSDLPMDVELAIAEAIGLAEARSICTCAECGEEGRLFSNGFRLFTACEKHATGIPIPTVAGVHDVYVVRAMVGGRQSLVQRRYHRPSDAFVELPAECPSTSVRTADRRRPHDRRNY